MAYLGNDLQVAYPTYKNIDDISGSFNSSTTSFPLHVNGVAPVPPPLNSQQCLISVGGVVQRPDDSGSEGFRLSGGNIIFASAPTTGADFFGVILAGADYVNAGGAFPAGSGSVPSITFAGDTDTGLFNYAPNEIGFGTGGVHHLTLTTAGQLAHNSGTAAAPSYSFTGDLNTGIYRPGADQIAISTNGTGRLFVNSTGLVGIGVSSPATRLEVNGTVRLSGGEDNQIEWFNNGQQWRINNSTAGRLYVYDVTNAKFPFGIDANTPSDTLVVKSSGRVGIGITSPATTLDLSGSYSANAVAVAALDINCSLGNYFTKTINGNSTFTVSNVPASRNYAFTLELEHTSGSITWFSGVEWPGGTAPTLTTGKTHLFIFQTDNGGTRWRASSLTNYTT